MPERKIIITTELMPAYYKQFHCLMGACQDTCCRNWEISFNKKDYLKIKQTVQKGEMKDRLERGLVRMRSLKDDNKYARFRLNENEECVFHSEEGLCLLQLKHGEETLPRVCRTFPRGSLCTAAALERSLSSACEGTLSLLWDLTEGIDFIEEPLEEKDFRMYIAKSLVEERFGEVRALCIDVLQERSLRVPQRLVLLGLLLQKLRELDWEDGEALDRWLAWGEALLRTPDISAQLEQMPRDREIYLNFNFKALGGMQGELGKELNDAMMDIQLDPDKGLVGGFSGPRYQEMEGKLEELLGHSEHFFENLLVAFTFGKGFPALFSPEELWKSYATLCAFYSVFHCAAVCACGKEASKERLFHVLVYVSRKMLHNKPFVEKVADTCFEHDGASLAYLTILVNG